MFFQGIYLVLLIGSRSSTFSFYLTFSVFKNLGVTVICFGLEMMFFCVRLALFRWYESNIFGVRIVFGMDASHMSLRVYWSFSP